MNRRSIVVGIVALCGGLVGACADSAATIGPDPDSLADGGKFSTTLPDGGGGDSGTPPDEDAVAPQDDGGGPSPGDGGGGPSPGDDVSGTRLRARRWVSDDGAKQFLGWYDSQLHVQCSFQLAFDSAIRCIPETLKTTNGLSDGFADTGCSEPLLYGNKGADPRPYGMVGRKIMQVGGRFTGATIYSGTPGNCTGHASSEYVGDYYRVGPEVPLSTFVKAIEQVD